METNELWELADPTIPTNRKGTAPDAMALALGSWLPVGLLSSKEEAEEDQELLECYPAYATGCPIPGRRVALCLSF